MPRFRHRLLWSSVTLACLNPALAAAEQANGGAIVLDQVEVSADKPTGWSPVNGVVAKVSATATKTDTPLSETPQAVSVVTRAQMDMQQSQSLGEALRYTPGVVAGLSNSDNRYDQISLRGFGVTTLGLYRDGLRQMSNQMTTKIEPFGLERLDVMRGPASVLYGQAAPGGMVNAITKRPTEKAVHLLEVQAGSDDRRQGAFDIGGKATEDGRVLYRLTGLLRDSEAQVDHTRDDRLYLAPALTLRPSRDFSLTLLANYQKDDGGTPSPLPAVGTILHNDNGRIPNNRFSGDPALNEFDRTQQSVGWMAEYRFDDTWQLRQNTRYDRLEFDQANVYAYSALTPSATTVNRMAYRFGVDSDLLNTDTQLQADWKAAGLPVTSLFGIDYRFNGEDFYQFNGSAPPLNLYAPVYGRAIAVPSTPAADSRTDISQLGLYTQQQVTVADRLALTLGGRYDAADSKVENHLTKKTSEQSDEAFTWRAGAAWVSGGGWTPYASYSTSFAPVSGTDYAGNAFQPSEAEQLEMGLKIQPSGFDGSFTMAWYDITQTNVQTTDPAHPNFKVQTGEVRSRGIELEAQVGLADGLTLVGGYAWQKPEVTKSNANDLGKRPTGIPDHMASLWLDYAVQDGPAQGLGLGAGVRYVGDSAGSADNGLTVPSYTLVDAALRYSLGDWQAALNVNNLFDRYYVAGCSSTASCSMGYGRTVLATLRYSW